MLKSKTLPPYVAAALWKLINSWQSHQKETGWRLGLKDFRSTPHTGVTQLQIYAYPNIIPCKWPNQPWTPEKTMSPSLSLSLYIYIYIYIYVYVQYSSESLGERYLKMTVCVPNCPEPRVFQVQTAQICFCMVLGIVFMFLSKLKPENQKSQLWEFKSFDIHVP